VILPLGINKTHHIYDVQLKKKSDFKKMLPKKIECPHCDTTLELEESERKTHEFVCPHCNNKVHINDEYEKADLPYAGFWLRLASFIIDWSIINGFALVLIVVFSLAHSMFSSEVYLGLILFLWFPVISLAAFSYVTWFNSNGKQTVGKRFFQLRVVNKKGDTISVKRSLARTLVLIVYPVTFFVGYIVVALKKNNQALHDLVSGTYVLKLPNGGNRKPLIVSIVLIVAMIFLLSPLSTFIKNNYVASYKVPSGGMENTILVGDFMFVDKAWKNHFKPESGDLVVFKYPVNPQLDFIKRCVAVGGQTVKIIDKKIYVDGEPFHEPTHLKFIDRRILSRDDKTFPVFNPDLGSRDNFGPVVVPPNHYFVLGDNRDNSLDSRAWGFVPQENIIGKAGIIWFSWESRMPLFQLSKKIRWNRIGKMLQ
jgi:signal peptidase I